MMIKNIIIINKKVDYELFDLSAYEYMNII